MSTFLSAKQAARYCSVSTKTVLRWIESGRLKADKRGRAYRIAPGDLEPFRRPDAGHLGDSGHAGHKTADTADSGRTEDSGQDGLLALVAQLSDKLAQQAATTAMWQTRAEVLATRLRQAEDTIRALEAPRAAPTDAPNSHEDANLTAEAPEPTRGPPEPEPEPPPSPAPAPIRPGPDGRSWWRRWWAALAGTGLALAITASSCQASTPIKHAGLCSLARRNLEDVVAGNPSMRAGTSVSWQQVESILADAEGPC